MTNEEFYKDELKKLLVNSMGIHKDSGKPMSCECVLLCEDCIFCDNCSPDKIERWLQSEHVEQVDWSNVKVDTPIYVRDSEEKPWIPRYFARYENGRVDAWSDGGTSFSKEKEDVVDWNYAKLAESEEK